MTSLAFLIIILASGVKFTAEKVLEGEYSMVSNTVDGVTEACYRFAVGDSERMEFYSPGYPGNYPNHTDCIKVLEAAPGHILKLDFRDKFNLESTEDCRFDYLEVRDGAHGYSPLIGVYCGSNFPPILTSSSRFLWLRFHSDENIELSGFRAVYSEAPKPTSDTVPPELEDCRLEKSGMEGYVNRSDIDPDHVRLAVDHGVPLDCMWVIKVQEGWRIQLNFNKFQLAVPNDCESNFVDIFAEKTDLPSRLHNFCGSIAELVMSPGNILQLRFLAEPNAINSNFEALFTAFRDKPKGMNCEADEYDCEDGNCISLELKCNGRINCRFRWDEDPNLCQSKQGVLSAILNAEHMIIILVVFFLILTGMCFAFLFNCFRKLVRDHRTIQEHMRMSREARLEDVGKKGSRSRLAADGRRSPPRVDCYVPGDLLPGELMAPEMVDSQCQTRESLFRPPAPPGAAPPPVIPAPQHNFTTFGYSSDSSASGAQQGSSAFGPPEPRATSMESTKSAPDVIMSHH